MEAGDNTSLPPPPPTLTLPPLPPPPAATPSPVRRKKTPKMSSPATSTPSTPSADTNGGSTPSVSSSSSSLLLSPPTPKHSPHPSSPPQSKKKRRSPYKCHKCGKPKKGHICTAVDPSSLALFKEREARPPQPAYPQPSSPPSLSLAGLAATSSALSPSTASIATTSSPFSSASVPATPSAGDWPRIVEEEEADDDDLQNRQLRPLPSYNGNEEEMGRVKRGIKKRGRRGGEDEAELDPEGEAEGYEGEEVMGMGLSRHAPFLGEMAALYNTSSDNLFPTDALSRYELGSAANPLEAAAAYGSGSSWANWGSAADAVGDDLDISLFGYIDERPPEKVSGVGISIDQKKVPYFVSWFDMAVSGLGMLETFLKTQRPVWGALPTVLDSLQEQKRRLNAWKENFGKEVIDKAIEEVETPPQGSPDADVMALIAEHERAGAKRKTSEEEDQEASGRGVRDVEHPAAKRRKSASVAAQRP